jgi:hypothetical protein
MWRQTKLLDGSWKCQYIIYKKMLLIDYTCVKLTHFCFPVHIYRYAYAVASALHGVRHNLRKDFMIQVLNNSLT